MHSAIQSWVITALHVVPTKAFHLQILLDPLEEQLHLPARLVDVRNGPRRQIKVRRQKHVVLLRLPVPVPDASQPMRALLPPLRARELDDLIRRHASLRIAFSRLQHAILDPPLETRHQVNSPRNQRRNPREVHVRPIRRHDAARRQRQCPRRLDVRRLPVRHPERTSAGTPDGPGPRAPSPPPSSDGTSPTETPTDTGSPSSNPTSTAWP